MARDKYKWSRVTDPQGGTHWIREKNPSRSHMVGKAMHRISSFSSSLPAVFLLFALFRFVLYKEFGFQDTYFVKYPNSYDLWGNPIDLYYVNVFQWVKDVLTSIGNFKQPLVSLIETFSGVLGDNVADNAYNIIILLLNVVLSIWKVLMNLPLTIVGIIVGGPFSSWINEGGWIYVTMRWNIPYAEDVINNITAFFNWLGSAWGNQNIWAN